MRIRYGFVAGLLICIQATGAFCQTLNWNNTSTGALAGDWFVATNWDLLAVPTLLDVAHISNGGEAKVDILTAVGSVVANRIEVGKNNGVGTFTDNGVAILLNEDLDIGEVGGGVAIGPVIVNGNGTATISDAASIQVGNGGTGDIDVGQASSTLGAQAFGNGMLTIVRVPLVSVPDNVEIGQTSGTALATGNGTIIAQSVTNFNIGRSFSVGETGPTVGIKSATGVLDFDLVGTLDISDDLSIGRTFGVGGQDTGNGTATLTNSGMIIIGNNLEVGSSTISGGGTADSTGALTIQGGSSLSVNNLVGIGQIRNTSGSGQTSALGNATISDVNTIDFATDVFVGRIFTRNEVAGTADGTLTIERSNSLSIGGDFDVGQTGTAGVSAAGLGSANGTGNATLRDIVGTILITGDIDVGQTSGIPNTSSMGNGTLLIERAGGIDVGIDFDIGQAGGTGQATAIGTATIRDTPFLTVGEDFDIGRTSSSASGINSGSGILLVSDSTVSVGFASTALDGDFDGDSDVDGKNFLTWQRGFGILIGAGKAQGDANLNGGVNQADLAIWESTFGDIVGGSLNVGDASVVGNERVTAFGRATFERVSLNVAGRINVGGLAGGSTNPLTTTDSAVTLIASSVSASVVDVAVIPDGTAGTATGQLHLNPSLLTVSGPITLGSGATLTLDLAGTIRSDGTGALGQYSAINADSAMLDGVLEIVLAGGFTPSLGNFFDLLSTSGTISGTFSSQVLPVLPPTLSWNLIQTTNLLRLEVQGPPAVSAAITQVPEPSSWLLCVLTGVLWGSQGRTRLQKKGRRLCPNMGVIEQ